MPAKPKKIGTPKNMKALMLWHGVSKSALRELPFDFSARQMLLLLTVHLEAGTHNVKSLSKHFRIPKAAVSRALEMLVEKNLLRKTVDKNDSRKIQVHPTAKGRDYLKKFSDIISATQKNL